MGYGLRFLFLYLIVPVDPYRILGLFPLPIKSHFIFFEAIMKGLVERGHEVHVVSHFPRKNPIERYYDISISESIPYRVDNISISYRLSRSPFGMAWHIFKTCGSEICEYLLKHPNIIALKHTSLKFDAIISETYGTDCLLGFAHHFGVPIIGASSTDILPWSGARMGNPDNPSHVPNYLGFTNRKMVIAEKIFMVGLTFLSKIGYFCISTVVTEMRSREFFGKQFPPMENVLYNTSILLSNTHLSVTEPRPMVPGVIEVGGLHIAEPKPLSPNIADILEKNQAIYFSMGTVVNTKTLQPEELQTFIEAFRKLPYQIIWSGISNVTVPENVHLFRWVEQLDILCDPKVKAFITHGGLLSVQEAIFCGKPILGLPVFPDQQRNVERMVENGAGILRHIHDFDVTTLVESLNHLVQDESYKESAEKMSIIFKDRPLGPLNEAMYWIEYVIKHGGAHHIKTKSSKLAFFDYYLLDVVILFVFMFILIVRFLFFFLDVIQNYFDSQNDVDVIKKEK